MLIRREESVGYLIPVDPLTVADRYVWQGIGLGSDSTFRRHLVSRISDRKVSVSLPRTVGKSGLPPEVDSPSRERRIGLSANVTAARRKGKSRRKNGIVSLSAVAVHGFTRP